MADRLSPRMRAVLDALARSETPLSECDVLHAIPVHMRRAGAGIATTIVALACRGLVRREGGTGSLIPAYRATDRGRELARGAA